MIEQSDEALIDAVWKHSLNWGSREDMLELAAAHREAAYAAGLVEGEKQAEARIVEWLRASAEDYFDEEAAGPALRQGANAIERGDHRSKT